MADDFADNVLRDAEVEHVWTISSFPVEVDVGPAHAAPLPAHGRWPPAYDH
jgi:hypothetical protein